MTVYRRMTHAVFSCDYHIVWPTKYRRKILSPGVQGYLLEVVRGLPEHRPDLIVKEINTDEDYIHILISIPPSVTVGSVVGLIKSNTARSLNEKAGAPGGAPARCLPRRDQPRW